MRLFALHLATLILFVSGSSHAQTGNPDRDAANAVWSILEVGDCHIILNHGSVELSANGHQVIGDLGAFLAIRWSGGCDADGLITGRGELQVDYDAEEFVGFRGPLRYVFDGQADRGLLNGSVQFSNFEPESDNGPLILRGDDFGDRRWDLTFVDGCVSAIRGEAIDTACTPHPGGVLRASYLARRADSGTAQSSAGRSQPLSSSPVRPGRTPFLNSCLSLKAPEGDREPGSWGANVWTIQNSCQVRLHVTWCADEDRREPLRNICANKAAATNELLAGGTIIFDSVAPNLSIQAFACRAPDFPQDVDFNEDRRLTASGCP